MYAIYFSNMGFYLAGKDSEIKVFKTYKWAQARIDRYYRPDEAKVVKIKIVLDETIGTNELRG